MSVVAFIVAFYLLQVGAICSWVQSHDDIIDQANVHSC